ncbi:MAG: hypothetical protein MnENMB40S_06860 [Rhizobiaceae bacterium MnEN-MB40S]|nr:MAG: hypothetical protein MnENMB40S_06860 [Rhizobiaceae bacterium MnEN-MB40S]
MAEPPALAGGMIESMNSMQTASPRRRIPRSGQATVLIRRTFMTGSFNQHGLIIQTRPTRLILFLAPLRRFVLVPI